MSLLTTTPERPKLLLSAFCILPLSSYERTKSLLWLHPISSLSSADNSQSPPTEDSDLPIPPIGRTRTRTPLVIQFETCTEDLKSPRSTSTRPLHAQSDPDLALNIFQWTPQQRNFKHNHVTYLTMLKILIDGRRYRHAETLVEEVMGRFWYECSSVQCHDSFLL